MADLESLESLRNTIENQRKKLLNTDISIKKITGRLPGEDKHIPPENINIAPQRRPLSNIPTVIYSSVYSSDSVPKSLRVSHTDRTEDDVKVSLASSVVRVGEKRSRKDAMQELKTSDRERGRRMFNILQSTLNQFKQETVAATGLPQMERRRRVDEKVEAKAEKDRETLRQERTDLFRQRRELNLELALLHQKLRMVQGFETWKEETMKMSEFIRTETSPHIFYKPKNDNQESTARKESTKTNIIDLIHSRRMRLESDFEEMAAIRRRRFGQLPTTVDDNKEDKMQAVESKTQIAPDTSLDGLADHDMDDDFAMVGDEDETWVGSSPKIASKVVNAHKNTVLLDADTSNRTVTIMPPVGPQSESTKEELSSLWDTSAHYDEPILMEADPQPRESSRPSSTSPQHSFEEDRRRVILPSQKTAIVLNAEV